jgi:nucleoside-diphosphate-sugar epimerase
VSEKKVTLITGANGEVGHGLIERLSSQPDSNPVVVLDIRGLDESKAHLVDTTIVGDILDISLLDTLLSEYEVDTIFHLAALLSTHSEVRPESAHRVNVQGTINLLQLAIEQARWRGSPVKFVFPSSIAVYGVPDLELKESLLPLREEQYNQPITMYGCNKLYCEHLGRYYMSHYQQLSAIRETPTIDFRSLRFPGLVSAFTMPSGGTSDFAPEMVHAAARGEPYSAFVRPDTTIPFMVMPDAIDALLLLAAAPREHLMQSVYNVTSFSLSAEQIADIVHAAFPGAQIDYAPSVGRQTIVDSWPASIDDSAARRDWGWSPQYDAERAFNDYLLPAIRQHYRV